MHNSPYIDPQIKPMLEQLAAHFGDYLQLTVDETRALFAQASAAGAKPLPAGCTDELWSIPGPAGPIPCRAFRPSGAVGPLPILLNFLGGTYVAKSLDHVGALPPNLAVTLGCMVVVPLHRIPPEHPYPMAFDDCSAVYSWLRANGGTVGGAASRIVVLGESSGATLAAAVCIRARDMGQDQPLLQVLAEPLLDFEAETPSLNEFSYVLSKAAIRFGTKLYFGDRQPPREASPLRADSLAGLCPAYIVTAGLDPLRDEGIAYVARLRAEGGSVTHRHQDGQIHGFFSMFEQSTQALICFHECCAVIRLAFDGRLPAPPPTM